MRKAMNDFNGDGSSDLAWRLGDGNVTYWQMNGATPTFPDPNLGAFNALSLPVIASGDFNGDGAADIIHQLPAEGPLTILLGKASTAGRFRDGRFMCCQILSYPQGWQVIGGGDVNNDGSDDLVWQSGRKVVAWLMSNEPNWPGGVNLISAEVSVELPADGFIPLALADFTGDGLADIAWRSPDDGLYFWVGRGAGSNGALAFDLQPFSGFPVDWNFHGTADINGDGSKDIVWYNGNTLSYWQLTGNAGAGGQVAYLGAGGVVLPQASRLFALGDTDGDSDDDAFVVTSADRIVMLNNQSGGNVWTQVQVSAYPPAQSYHPLAPNRLYASRYRRPPDANLDARADLGWHRPGNFSFWLMNGSAVQGYGGGVSVDDREMLGRGEFDGDHLEDILWKTSSGELHRWRRRMDGYVDEKIGPYPQGWSYLGAADVNEDGMDDIVWWRNGGYSFWLMRGRLVHEVGGGPVPDAGLVPLEVPNVQDALQKMSQGVGILWRAPDGKIYRSSYIHNYRSGIYSDIDPFFNFSFIGTPTAGSTYIGSGDMDADGEDEVLWHDSSALSMWELQGSTNATRPMTVSGTIIKVIDTNGDGFDDLVWRNAQDALQHWSRTGVDQHFISHPVGDYPAGWVAR